MKRIIFLLLVGLFFSTGTLQAQFNLGPKVGVNSSRLSLKDNVSNVSEGSASFGFHAGLFARIELAGLFLQPEFLYTSAGGQLEFANGQLGNQIRTYEFNRVDVPLHIGFKLGNTFRLGAAPIFSVLLSDNQQGNTNQQIALKNSTVGYQVGLGADIWNLVLDLRYEGNLSGVADNFLGTTTDQRLNQWTFGVGLKIF
jgi:opacity protein-like surface antigen